MASIEVPLDTVSSSSGVYSGAASEGSNSPDSHHVARLLVNQVIVMACSKPRYMIYYYIQ